MELPKPWTRDIIQYSRAVVRETLPTGANQHYQRISRGWQKPRGRSSVTVGFSITGECQGTVEQVTDLGLRMAREAIAKGDQVSAEAILTRVKSLAKEREVQAKERELARLNDRLWRALRR